MSASRRLKRQAREQRLADARKEFKARLDAGVHEKTYWNGEPCQARKVKVVVGRALQPTWWCAGLEGTVREAVEVTQEGYTFYLDNEDGSGWLKVTYGLGSPQWGHNSLPVERVVDEAESQ